MGHITIDRSGGASGSEHVFADMVAWAIPANLDNAVAPATTEGWDVSLLGGNRELTGIVAPAGQETYWIVNTTDDTLKLKKEDGNSAAANRFMLPDGTDYNILGGSMIKITYNPTVSRWMLVNEGKS